MSQANVELVQRGFEHFVVTGEPAWETLHEHVEVYDHDIMDGREYRGHADVRRWLYEDWAAAWSDYSAEPQEVEIIKAGIDAWNAGDMDRFRDMYDPNVVLQTVPDWPEPGPYVGREAVMGFFKGLRETWAFDAVEPHGGFIEVADHVLVRHTWRGLGRGPDLNMATTLIFTLRRGKVIYQEYFWDHTDALKAVGLEE